jgi:hypothetical protein
MTKHLLAGGKIHYHNVRQGRNVTQEQNGVDVMLRMTICPNRLRVVEKSCDVVSGLKHNNRLKCHRGIVSQWTFEVGLNVTVDETWVDGAPRHRSGDRTMATLVSLLWGLSAVVMPWWPQSL